MQHKDNKVFKQAVTIVAVFALTTAIGVAVSAQMGPGRGQMGDPGAGGPGGQGMRGGPGMMGGPGRMGGPDGGLFGGPLGMLGRGMRELGVTDEQRDQIRGKMDLHKTEFEAIAGRMIEAREALEDAVTAETVNEAAIRAAAAAVAGVEADAAVLRASVHQEVLSVLTSEQKQKAKELRGQMEQRMKEGRQRMKEGRRPIRQRTETERGGSELV
jgi:Spy/CpxP family protein refolding chaperone